MPRKPRFNYQKRDARIRQLHEAGVPAKKIGRRFGISENGVYAVLNKLQAEEKAVQRSAELLQELRAIDDLDRNWAVEYLLDALNLATRPRTAIKHWYEWHEVSELSLRELMELVISDKPHAKRGWLVTPLLYVRNVKLDTFWSTVKRLTEADLGEKCNLEWKRRVGRLIQATRIVSGMPLSWSKACEPPDWLVQAAS